MNAPSILGPSGTPMVDLSADRAWLQRTVGDITVSFQWIKVPGERDPVACMVLFCPTRRLDTGAYVIPFRNAYRFANADGSPTRHLLEASVSAAEQLGFDRNDRATIRRIVDVIVEGLPDLIDMPSDQPPSLDIARLVRGIEARLKVEGRTLHEAVL